MSTVLCLFPPRRDLRTRRVPLQWPLLLRRSNEHLDSAARGRGIDGRIGHASWRRRIIEIEDRTLHALSSGATETVSRRLGVLCGGIF